MYQMCVNTIDYLVCVCLLYVGVVPRSSKKPQAPADCAIGRVQAARASGADFYSGRRRRTLQGARGCTRVR